MGIMNLFGTGTPAGAAAENILNGISSVFDVILNPNMSIDELAGVYSAKLDEMIVAEEAKKLKYVGGSFDVECINAVQFQASYELYFQDEKKEWVKKNAKSKPQNLSLLKPMAAAELRQKKKVSFDIEPPDEKVVKEQVKKDVPLR